MRRHTADIFDQFVSWISTIAITLGVMIMIIVLSVMNGFEYKLQNSILKLIPQAVISSATSSLNPQLFPKSDIKLHGVHCITPLVTGNVIIKSNNGVAIGVMLGIDLAQKDPLTSYLINIKDSNHNYEKYNVILGEQLAKKLDVNIGSKLYVIVPSSSQFTPIGRHPVQRLFNIIGTFATDSEADNYQIITNINDASRLMHYPLGHITGWRLWLDEPLKVDKISRQKIPNGTKWQDWRESRGELFKAIQIEKNMMGLLLSLIITISAFNIITSLVLIIIDKQKEIAILQTQGLIPHQIMIIFLMQGVSIGIIGTFLGTILGILLTNQLNKLIQIISILFDIASLPVAIEPMQIIYINLVTISIVLLSTFYPSWQAAITHPTEALRYE